MKKEFAEYDTQVLGLITSGIANTQAAIAKTTDKDTRFVDNCLRRLKTANLVQFVKADKRWTIAEGAAGSSGDSKTPPSAPTGEAGVVSGQEATADTQETTMTVLKTEESTESNIDNVDAAIEKARAAKGQKPAKEKSSTTRVKLTAEEKEARDKQRETEKAERKELREKSRAEKKAAKAGEKKPAHMSKVEKAASKLPSMTNDVSTYFNELTANLSSQDINALAAHLVHFNRSKATERALSQQVKMGDKVKIVGGEAKYIGLEGVVSKAQRIRCYVTVEGFKKDIYLFTSDVEVTEALATAANG